MNEGEKRTEPNLDIELRNGMSVTHKNVCASHIRTKRKRSDNNRKKKKTAGVDRNKTNTDGLNRKKNRRKKNMLNEKPRVLGTGLNKIETHEEQRENGEEEKCRIKGNVNNTYV